MSTPLRSNPSSPAPSHGSSFDPAASTLLSPAAAITEGPGTRIGVYKILELIGEGGFGSVFMAEQDSPVRRRVALKIIKLGMDTRQVVARFEQERQALAIMDHPHIAKVFDAGATDSGRPYFVMEYVRGESVTKLAAARKLDLSARLDLFMQVCQAIQHAHTKGIIHRDLKPSNVLAFISDGKPFVKVIDFGIAKATGSRLTDKTLFTEHRALIGTPEYMSPEQAEGSLDIDTRTDVYSLGVLLYELLTGLTPFDSVRLRSAAYAEMQRIIREEDPPAPSLRLERTLRGPTRRAASSPLALGAGKVEGAPSLPPVPVVQQPLPASPTSSIAPPAPAPELASPSIPSFIDLRDIQGELDWIVMKALDKDRSRRYDSATALAQDVQRHLVGEPVLAAPASAAYRVRKFVRKHRGPVIAGAVVAGALILGIIGTSWGLWRAERSNAVLRRHQTASIEAAEKILLAFIKHITPAGEQVLTSEDFSTQEKVVLNPDGSRRGSFKYRWDKDGAGNPKLFCKEYDALGRETDTGLLIEQMGQVSVDLFDAYEREIAELKAAAATQAPSDTKTPAKP